MPRRRRRVPIGETRRGRDQLLLISGRLVLAPLLFLLALPVVALTRFDSLALVALTGFDSLPLVAFGALFVRLFL